MKIVGRYLLRMMLFLAFIIFILNLHYDKLLDFFFTNQTLNSIIIFVIFIGNILYSKTNIYNKIRIKLVK